MLGCTGFSFEQKCNFFLITLLLYYISCCQSAKASEKKPEKQVNLGSSPFLIFLLAESQTLSFITAGTPKYHTVSSDFVKRCFGI